MQTLAQKANLATKIAWFVSGLSIGVFTGIVIPQIFQPQKNISHKRLSESALSYLLNIVYYDRYDNVTPYTKMNGDVLPPMSGGDYLEALLTYIDRDPEKHRAISKFLQKNLNSLPQIDDFFQIINEKYLININNPDFKQVQDKVFLI